MNFSTSSLTRSPLLTRLMATQIATILVGIGLLLLVVGKISEANIAAGLTQERQVIEPKLQSVATQWRTWKFLGMQTALEASERDLLAQYPIKSIEVLPSDMRPKDGDPATIVLPDTDGIDSLPNVLVVKIDPKKYSQIYGLNSLTTWAILIIGFLFLASILMSGLFIWRNFHRPIAALNDAFNRLELGEPLQVDSINSTGEIAAFASNIQGMYESYTASEKARAVAQMTQMLAHDVRKPFSILRMGLGMLGNAKDPAGVKRILSNLMPQIDKAVSSVDGLIADVMEVGSTSTHLIQEQASPESLIESTLGDIFRVYPQSDVTVAYDFQHTHMVNVHVQKIGRVFSNIVGNAVQAMNYKGPIWFRTRERNGLVEFCLGNAGSVIPPECLPKLFDAFFTSGKKGGTGLGLAIAHKVVTAHGGRIWCESLKTLEHPDGRVEFFFTLPIAESHRCKSTASLPRHSSEFTQPLEALTALSDGKGTSVDKGEMALEVDLIQASVQFGRPLHVLVVDDEPIYRSALASYLNRTPELGHAITVVPAANSTQAVAATESQSFDLVITDVDMGSGSLDGFELVRDCRAEGMKSLICVHSNRIVTADHQSAFDVGADAFLPKPVARAQLLRLALQAAERRKEQELAKPSPVALPQETPPCKPELLVVDDNVFVLDAWVDVLSPDAKVHVATSMASLESLLAKDAELVNRLALVVTDFHLDDGVADGADIGRKLKGYRLDLQVILSSDGDYDVKEFGGAIDRAIGKNPAPLSVLMEPRT